MFLHWTKAKRGTAILLILFIMSLVVMFLGALISTNQTSIRLATGLNADKNATANCQSGLDYAWQLIERDQAFGRTNFPDGSIPGYNEASARLDIRLRNPNNNVDNQYIEARYLDRPEAGFRVRIANKIHLTASTRAQDNPLGYQAIPPFSVMIKVEGFDGKRTRVLEALLQKAPFIAHGLFSGQDVTCQWGNEVAQWDVASNDPFRNSIRTKGKLRMDRVTSGSLKFSPAQGTTASTFGRYGAALPSLGVFDTSGSNELDSDGYTDASRQSRGMVLNRSAQNDKIKELGADALKVPDIKVNLPGGTYRFEKTRFDIKIEWQEEVEESYQDEHGNPGTRRVWQDRSETKQLYAKAFARYINDTDQQAAQMWLAEQHLPHPPATSGGIRGGQVSLVNQPNAQIFQLAPDGAFDLPGSSGGLAARVNFSEGTFDVPANTMLTFDGSFKLQHRGLDTADARPKVRLVNQTNPEDESQPFTAGIRARGDLTIEGGLRGSGTVIADGKLEMYAESSLATSTDRPVALYAGGDVNLKKDDAVTEDKTSQATLGEDWTMFKRSLGSSPELDTLLNDSYTDQITKVSGLLSSTIKNEAGSATDPDPSYYFSQVTGTFFPAGDPDNLMTRAQSAYTSIRSGGVTVDEAIRFREYCRQLAIDAHATTEQLNPETGEMETVPAQAVAPRWLDAAAVADDVVSLVQSQLASYGNLVGTEIVDHASQYKSLRQWFLDVATNPYENDATRDNSIFRGLVYSRNGSFQLDANFNSLTVIGALVVPKGKITFNRPSGIRTIYDPKYLRDLLVAQPETTPIKLDQVYWRMF